MNAIAKSNIMSRITMKMKTVASTVTSM